MSGAAHMLPQDHDDPFGTTADPARYVPRQITERALEDLERAVADRESSALLVGVPGIGKTLLLRLLKRRLESRLTVVHLPYAALPPAALANWALDELDAHSSWDPVGALATRARHLYLESLGAIVLLIDDAEALPEETARALVDMAEQSQGGLRYVAAVDQEAAERLEGWVGELPWVRLLEAMTPAETFQYIHTRLHGSDLPESALAAFDPDALRAIHDRSGGIPGRVGAEASALLLRALLPRPTPASPVTPPFASDEDRLLESLFPDPLEAREPLLEGEEDEDWAEEARRGAVEDLPELEVDLDELRALEASAYEDVPQPAAQPAQEAPAAPPIVLPAPEPAPAADPAPAAAHAAAPEADRERQAGRAALARGGVREAPDTAAFERAAGRLALAHEEDLSREEDPGQKDRLVGPARVPGSRLDPRWARGLGLLGLCFVVGLVVGPPLLRLASDEGATPVAEAPAPEEALPPVVSPPPPPVVSPPPPVRVQVNARPWAHIRVDGEEVGVTPLAGLALDAGPHAFEARFPDGRVVERVEEIGPESRWVVFE